MLVAGNFSMLVFHAHRSDLHVSTRQHERRDRERLRQPKWQSRRWQNWCGRDENWFLAWTNGNRVPRDGARPLPKLTHGFHHRQHSASTFRQSDSSLRATHKFILRRPGECRNKISERSFQKLRQSARDQNPPNGRVDYWGECFRRHA